MDKILSICIASYNKAEMTESLVRQILKNKNPLLGVTVVDNASDDNTVERLIKIADDRLKVLVNDENIGGSGNMIKSVLEGEAVFSLYVNDRDMVYPDKLDAFIEFLCRHSDLTGGWCTRYERTKEEYTEYDPAGALRDFCFRGEHPTGFFFRRESLKKISGDRLRLYADTSKFVPFPWESLQAELSCIGKTCIYQRTVWKSTGDTTHTGYVSSYVNLESAEDRWFSPVNSIKRAQFNLQLLCKLMKTYNIHMGQEDLGLAYAHIVAAQEKIGLWRYCHILSDKGLCAHYAVKKRKVLPHEMLSVHRRIVKECGEFIEKTAGSRNTYMDTVRSEVRRVDIMMLKIQIKEGIIKSINRIKGRMAGRGDQIGR